MNSDDHDATKGNRYSGDQFHPEVSRLPINLSQLSPGPSFDPQTSDSEIDENENEFLNELKRNLDTAFANPSSSSSQASQPSDTNDAPMQSASPGEENDEPIVNEASIPMGQPTSVDDNDNTDVLEGIFRPPDDVGDSSSQVSHSSDVNEVTMASSVVVGNIPAIPHTHGATQCRRGKFCS
jgi:hypothetical protein